MTTSVALAITAVVGLVSLILKWWFGGGKLEKSYYDTMAQLKTKQDERTIALQKGDWTDYHLLTDECSKLSETADNFRQRLKSCGIVPPRPK